MGEAADGLGSLGFEIPGFLKDVGKSAASSALSTVAKKVAGGGGSKPAAAGGAPAGGARPAAKATSTGAKVAIVGGVVLALVLVARALRGRAPAPAGG
jgi:hypothetical protein